uniref:(California timema) hypothetical protein n=1 Tax=Timema californicum TaxID=61474 RepID=A0A7R9PBU7_TIMCA|nr:unnamed protein product [Timema californicum]
MTSLVLIADGFEKLPDQIMYSYAEPYDLQKHVPYLSEHLSSVLPTALITVDDFNTETQVFGISCLEHIIEHVTRTELNWYGQGDVIYKALERLLYHREAELVRPLLRCVVLLLGKLEGGYTNHDNNYKWSRCDDVLQIVLQNTEHEQNIPLRRAYIDSLPALLDASKMGVIRWSKRLLRILREYLEVAGYSEHDSAIPTLQLANAPVVLSSTAEYGEIDVRISVLKVYLKHSQPRIAHNSEALFQMLLRLLYDITKSSEGGGVQSQKIDSLVFQETVDLIEECLDIVVKNAPVQALNIGSDIKTRALFNETYSSPMASLVLTDSSQLTSDSQRLVVLEDHKGIPCVPPDTQSYWWITRVSPVFLRTLSCTGIQFPGLVLAPPGS